MPLIKARDAETKIAQAEVLRFQDVEAEAQRILADAGRQADAILADAKVRADRLQADARKAGLDAGRAEGLKTGHELGRKQAFDQARSDFVAQHAQVAKALAAALEQFEARRRGMLSEMERDVVALAGAIASRVTKRAVDIDPACLAENLREALQLVSRRTQLEIRLHPQDLEHARRFAQDLLSAEQLQSAAFLPDESVGRGGVILRTAGGHVDATVQTQWSRILDEILAGWQDHWLLSPAVLAPAEPADAAPEAQDDGSVVEILPVTADDPASSFVEIISPDQADAEIGEVPDVVDEVDPAARQALIEQALAEAMRAASQPPAPAGAEQPSDAADAGVNIEEIEPDEVEEIDPQ